MLEFRPARPAPGQTPFARRRVAALLASAILFTAMSAAAGGRILNCDPPDFVTLVGERHDHPTLLIMYYKRNPVPGRTDHDVVRLVTPPRGLGIEARGHGRNSEPAYRSVHVDSDDGRLHVQPVAGKQYRLCQLLVLWKIKDGGSAALRDIMGSAAMHIRIGGKYLRNVPVSDLLQTPLSHNEKIILFIEQKSAL